MMRESGAHRHELLEGEAELAGGLPDQRTGQHRVLRPADISLSPFLLWTLGSAHRLVHLLAFIFRLSLGRRTIGMRMEDSVA